MAVILIINGVPLGGGKNTAGVIRNTISIALGPFSPFGTYIPYMNEEKSPLPDGFDKLVHFTIYFLLALLFFKAFGVKAGGVAVLIAFGLIDELHQLPVPGRSFSANDLMFDTLGIFFVYYFLNEQH